mgnify:CR=1 FL=1
MNLKEINTRIVMQLFVIVSVVLFSTIVSSKIDRYWEVKTFDVKDAVRIEGITLNNELSELLLHNYEQQPYIYKNPATGREYKYKKIKFREIWVDKSNPKIFVLFDISQVNDIYVLYTVQRGIILEQHLVSSWQMN